MWFLLISRKKITFQYHWKSQQNKKGAKKPPSQPASSPGVWWQKSKKNKSLPRELWKTRKGFMTKFRKCPAQSVALASIIMWKVRPKEVKNLDSLETSSQTFQSSNSKSLSLSKLLQFPEPQLPPLKKTKIHSSIGVIWIQLKDEYKIPSSDQFHLLMSFQESCSKMVKQVFSQWFYD